MSRPPLMKPAQLRLLRAIGRHGQLQLAATDCGITQPAASRMLADIERQIGAPLFLRHPRGLEPTQAGALALRRSAVILHELDRLNDDVVALRQGMGGVVRIGAVSGAAIRFLVAAIRQVKAQSPAADIQVEVLPSADLLSHLVSGKIDIAISRLLPGFDTTNFDITPMQGETPSFLVRGGHPLAGRGDLTLAQVRDCEWILQHPGAPIRETTLHAFAAHGLAEPSNIVHSSSLVFTIAYLAATDAIAPVSQEMTDLLIVPPIGAGLATLTIPGVPQVAPYFLLYMRRRPLTPLAERLHQTIRDVQAQMADAPVR
ncbi:LysR family transcriptional regulator [Paracoccus sp. (in: a-proteobacteria)]|uniref:LysR family transcriptional regulator n=1 Tax=Paracoccus sp. TaxID=267 RepID=UPI0026DF0402|nr:LysR family transcriptional regulator [Paracoccus sp. (in: a-proteobacteria)]MDO5647465.1 LysR family transcriptional regulator [Paracoccus sp. (in: a-proteobacteria)]